MRRRNNFRHDEFVRAILKAIVRRASENADMVITLFNNLFPNEPKPGMPREAWLELAAVAQIGAWERQGLLPYLRTPLPGFTEALGQFFDWIEGLARQPGNRLECVLDAKVFRASLDDLALEKFDDEPADLVVRSGLDDVAIADLALFIWTHRAELESLNNGDTIQ